jgi:hypothetical protein
VHILFCQKKSNFTSQVGPQFSKILPADFALLILCSFPLFSLDPDILWKMVSPKIVHVVTLWDFLVAKLRQEHSNGSVSRKETLQFLFDEVEKLLQELSNLWKGCCHTLEDDNQVSVK